MQKGQLMKLVIKIKPITKTFNENGVYGYDK